jgi:diguanylate cyclase (GGDEF)-like protein
MPAELPRSVLRSVLVLLTRASIARAAILGVAGAMTFLGIVAIIVASHRSQSATTESLFEKATLTTNILAPNVAGILWNFDPKNGVRLLESLTTDLDFDSGIIIDEWGGLFAGFSRHQDDPSRLNPSQIAKLFDVDVTRGPKTFDLRTLALPDRVLTTIALTKPKGKDQYLGYLVLSFSRSRALASMQRNNFAIIGGGLVMLAAVCGLLAGILSRVTRPIREMTGAMRRLSDGEVDIDIPAMGRHDEIGEMARALAVFKEFAHMATHDALTGLPNRALLHERLEKALGGRGVGSQRFALHMLDLDRFKDINDTLGHAAGDELLRAFTTRPCSCVGDHDTVARLGGDEFCILQWTADPMVDASALATKVLTLMAAPLQFHNHPMLVGTSIGIAVPPEHGVDPDVLKRNADLALYQAKTAGRGAYRFFSLDALSPAPSQQQKRGASAETDSANGRHAAA